VTVMSRAQDVYADVSVRVSKMPLYKAVMSRAQDVDADVSVRVSEMPLYKVF